MRQRIVIAPDSFKGSASAAAVADALSAGWCSVRPDDEIVLLPMADGGEGTLDAFAGAVPGARRMPVTVTGPDGAPVEASWLLLPGDSADAASAGIAVVELASTCGIELLGAGLRPLDASTRGLGEAIAAALRFRKAGRAPSRLVIGLGSSASTDGGAGLLSALGARFLDAAGHPIAPGGRGLAELAAVDLSGLPPLPPGGVTVLSDVTNPLLGSNGAAAVFAPQKGASEAEVAALDAGLARLAALVGIDPALPGSGAAGGAGYGLLAWGAELAAGAAAMAELLGLPEAVAGASMVITGEGSFDAQSAAGKVPAHVAALAADAGVPVALVAGRIVPGAPVGGVAATVALTELAGSAEASLADPAHWLRAAGAAFARAFSGQNLRA